MVMSPAAEMRDSGASAVRDLGPLAWVLDETRRSIEAASKSLKRFARETDAARGIDLGSVDASPLRMARQQLHQVAGALDMVDQSVAALMVRGMEGAVQQFVQRPDKCTEETAQALERAGFALMEYLEAQMGSHPRSAVGLFPQYRRVQELAGADRIHPADLWSVPWSWADPVVPASAQPLSYDPEVRHRLDQRVLKILRHPAAHAADELAVISLSLAAGQMQRQATVFWLLSAGFFEALGRGLIVKDVYAKRAASRILMQYTSLARGGQVVSERLAHDLLFFCSQARFDADANTPALQAVRKAWSLDAQQATSYEQAMFGLYDPAILTEARRRILVLGRLAAAKRQDQPLSPLLLRNFRGAPFLLMSAEVTHIAEGKYGPAIAAWRHAAQPVFTLAMVEPGDRGRWFVADVGFLACDERFIAGSGH